MRVRAIDGTNDWLFGKGQNDYKTGNDAIAQAIKTELQSILGNCFFALNDGIDWMNLLGSKNLNLLQVAIAAKICTIDGVVSLNSLVVLLDDNRNAFIEWNVNTIYSQGVNGNTTVNNYGAFILTESGDFLTTEDGSAIEGG